MPIHSYILKYLDEHPNERINGIQQENPPNERRPAIHQIEDQIITFDGYDVPVRIYTPNTKEHFSLLVFFHEGRSMNDNLDSSDVPCRMIASFSEYKVISIDYPGALDNFSDTFEQCYNVTKWIVQNAKQFKGNSSNVSIAGGSIGATISTLITIEALKKREFTIDKQILFYPITAFDEKIEDSEYLSRKMYNGKYGIDLNNLKGLIQSNLNSPIATEQSILANMPNTLIYSAEYDPFSDEGETYAGKIETAGGRVELVRFDGNIHGFMQSFPGSPDYMRGFDVTTDFLTKEMEEVLS